MPEITLTIHHKAGLHARPAASFVQTALQFKSDIKVTHDEREANGKSILKVLTLGANQGAVITIRAEGEDAEAALAALEALIENNFGEEE
ncbi:MAG: HPr family phosphocarrier protein [Chloroflexi bacterium]|nr:MAG: PTS sugar transporter subunit IIA [Anaerolineaceae bacterium 4572_32.2]RLC73767.1 MAG: HPr family phosphocarrier protein [Chloroflexota bacterium]RLC78707.1 MAG: HPr family phosphocarrier protein [Chloroflexota bacterium]HEY73802.1 HPr family phosphocarrier protein [Thermoflexia bacterium]